MMVISFGFYSLLKSKSSRMLTFLKIIPFFIFVSSISLISWPMFSGDFGGLCNVTNKAHPYCHIVDTSVDNNNNYLSIPKENIEIVGGSNNAQSIDNSKLFDKAHTSLIFADKKDIRTLR